MPVRRSYFLSHRSPLVVESSASGPRRSLLVVTEPLVSADSSHFKFVVSVASVLAPSFEISIGTTFLAPDARLALHAKGFGTLEIRKARFFLNSILAVLGLESEATFWTEAWLREALFTVNSKLFRHALRNAHFDCTLNVASTVVTPCDLWWILGPPLDVTLASAIPRRPGLGPLRRAVCSLVGSLERKLALRIHSSTRKVVAGSNYVRDLYLSRGFSVDGTVFGIPDLSAFRPSAQKSEARFVLAYIGKEVELDTLAALAGSGIKVVGFGNKLVPGIDPKRLRKFLDFRGAVTRDQLIDLYSNAEFTAFPFTSEGLGLVPLESMACGTPVLTYGREGPSETMIDGETGWLVRDQNEFLQRAIQLWHGFDKSQFRARALNRASQFTPAGQARRLEGFILNGSNRPDA